VRALLASPKARGLFSAAIPASNLGGYDYATTYSLYYTPSEEYSTAAQAILQDTGCTNNDTAQEVSCLKSVSASTLVNLADVARYVIVDGTYITSIQLNVTARGQAAHVPVLWGSMAEDGAPFISYPAEGTTRTDAIYTILYGEPSIASAIISNTDLFPLPTGSNATLDVFNLTARLATDVEFRCIDQATVHSAIQNGVFPTAYYYQFDRSYQTPGWDPNAPTCDAPVTASHPLGDPSLPYFRCHSGDLMFQFGTLGQFDLGYRDEYDLPFMQLIMDYWTSFVRTHNPNPNSKYLAVRGYTNTSSAIASSGTWQPVSAAADTLRRLDYPGRQDTFQELTECQVLGLPINYYENATSSAS
jgi:carboxylesterase type B